MSRVLSLFALPCLLALAAGTAAATSPARAADPTGPVALLGARIHTEGPLGTIDNGAVLLEGGKIRAVGATLTLPANVRRIDVSGKVITPGLFDSLSRLGLVEVSQVRGTADAENKEARISAAFRVADAINPASSLIPVNRIEGLTHALVAPEPGTALIAGQAAVIHLGDGPDLVVRAPAAMFVLLGEAGAERAGGSRATALLELREALADARDWGENRDAYDRAGRRAYALSRLDLEALLPVARGELPLLVNCHRASDLRAALALAKEEGLRLILSGAAEGWKVAREIAAAKVPVILNPLDDRPESFEALDATLENAARLAAAGVHVAFASFDAHNGRNLRQGAGNAVAYGLPWDAALAAMTIEPARIWGVADRLGSIEAGKEANLVVWDADPLELTSYPDRVFIHGVEIPQRSRQLELRDRYRKLDGDLPPAYRHP